MNPRARKIIFTIGLTILPIGFFLLLEFGLRLFGWFRPEPFIIESQKNSLPVYQLNQWVARRYFDPKKVSVPAVAPETFSKYKTANTFRIFCLGESTTAGFPFDCQVPFPKQLSYLLRQTYPQYKFEVINAGISAVNSFTVLDLLPEILEHAPDLILIYLGHNEFYGAYGSASTLNVGSNGGYIRFYLKLQKLHLVQLLKRVLSGFASESAPSQKGRTLMADVIRDQEIALASETYRRTLHNFEDNLRIILQMCAQKKTPVVISNLVSNVRDLAPFHSLTPDLPKSARQEYERAIASGDSLLRLKNGEESIIAYSRAMAIDSSAAFLWFRLGKAYDAMGDSTQAAHHYYEAKDRDLIRFRASEEVNTILSKAADSSPADFVNMQRWFASHSPQGLIGANLMCDHLHPNPNGYYLMARAFYDHIVATGYVSGPTTDFQPANSPYFVSDLDWDIGLLKIFEMIHRWPFPEKALTFDDYQPHGDPLAAKIAREYLFVENVWSKAKYKMAAEFIKRNELEKARNEYLGVILFAPEDPYPYLQVAKTYEMEQAWPQREAYLRLALPFSREKGKIQYQIALAQWRQKKLDGAIASMSAALRQPDLNFKEKQNAGFYLAGFYADAQNPDAARQVLLGLLRDDPNFEPAKIFLHRLIYEENQAITTR